MSNPDDDPAGGVREDLPVGMHDNGDRADGGLEDVYERPRARVGPPQARFLPLGTRIGLVLALLLVVVALYHLFLPVELRAGNGLLIPCGRAVEPPSTTFLVNTCGNLVDQQQVIVTFDLIGAAVLAAGSMFAFGVRRRPPPSDADAPTELPS